MDLRQAHLRLTRHGRQIDMEMEAPPTQVWRWMARIMLATEKKDWRKDEFVEKYVRTRLGRERGDTFLVELSPVPARHGRDEGWAEVIAHREEELGIRIFASAVERRKKNLAQIISAKSNGLIICYGDGRKRAEKFAELLNIDWKPLYPRIATANDSRCILLPFFGTGQMGYEVFEILLSSGILSQPATR